jgi:hypothetical protein
MLISTSDRDAGRSAEAEAFARLAFVCGVLAVDDFVAVKARKFNSNQQVSISSSQQVQQQPVTFNRFLQIPITD